MIRKRRKRKYENSAPAWKLPSANIEIEEKIKKDAAGILIFGLALVSVLSFAGLAGELGENINKIARLLFGWGFVILPLVLFLLGWRVIKSENIIQGKASFVGAVIMVLSLLSFLHIVFFTSQEVFARSEAGEGGGFLGAVFAWVLMGLMGKWGAIAVIFTIFAAALLLFLNISFLDLISRLALSKNLKEADLELKKKNLKEAEDKAVKEGEEIKINMPLGGNQSKGILSSMLSRVSRKKRDSDSRKSGTEIEEGVQKENSKEESIKKSTDETQSLEKAGFKTKEIKLPKTKTAVSWKMPYLDILDGLDGEPTSGDIRANSNIIKRTLLNFGIPVEMGEVNVGPTVTQYTLKPSVGIKLSRITALQNDLALALAARSLRIEAPIPGKSWVGIEIPNQSVAMVRLRNILNSREFQNRKSNLSVVLGRDVAGNPVLADLGRMPHLMIAGSTGSGKTVCINTLITGLLFQNSPDALKFIMIDPKRVELTSYNDIPHLLTPVITDPDKAINSLKWSISEMENRYDLLSSLGCRNIESYNHAVKTKYKQREILPYIIIVIDELADLMATHGREMEAAVVRLAQMARAVGIHLVLSTQRPSVEVITGLIKANITTRIAFQVASQIDSRTILDMAGAEKLLGSGDMLYLSSDFNKPKRIQGVFISEEEVKRVADFLKNQKGDEGYNEEVIEERKGQLDFSSESREEVDDDLYYEAVDVVKNAGKASASLLQRRLRIGYARAARLLDLMEDKGIVGPADGAKPREVYGDETSDDTGDESGDGSLYF